MEDRGVLGECLFRVEGLEIFHGFQLNEKCFVEEEVCSEAFCEANPHQLDGYVTLSFNAHPLVCDHFCEDNFIDRFK